MKVTELIKLQSDGVFKVSEVAVDKSKGLVGGTVVSRQEVINLCGLAGWTEMMKDPFDIVTKTDKFVRSMALNLKTPVLLNDKTEVNFRNTSRLNSNAFEDRIKFMTDNYQVLITYRVPGTGGTYSVFTNFDGWGIPLASFSSLKKLFEYLNEDFVADVSSKYGRILIGPDRVIKQ